MAKFGTPLIDPLVQPKDWGTGTNVVSKYLANNFDQQYTVASWRNATNRATLRSDLTGLDTMYTSLKQSSPFLRSLIDKRILPMYQRNFEFQINGVRNERLTNKYINDSLWFEDFIKNIMMSIFDGNICINLDVKNESVIPYPMRNLDFENEGLREMTYDYFSIVKASDFDNLFYIQPVKNEANRFGLMLPIARLMIESIQMRDYWHVLGAQHTTKKVVVGYQANNKRAFDIAKNIVETMDDPTSVPVVQFTSDPMSQKDSVYETQITPIQTQTAAEAFRAYKEFISSVNEEIMQLVLGGTLLGATEKNTNSEQLVELQLGLYNSILNSDVEFILKFFNSKNTIGKLSRLFKDRDLQRARLVEIPSRTISVHNFIKIGEVLAEQGMKWTNSALERVGIDPIDVEVITQSSQIDATVVDTIDNGE